MDKNSRAYVKLAQLESEGYKENLINEARQATDIQEEASTSGMGLGLSKVTGILTQGSNFLKGKIWDQVESDQEYELTEDPIVIETHEDNISEHSRGAEDDEDPILYSQTEEFDNTCRKIVDILTPHRPPVFYISVPENLQPRFREMINWVNQTSKSRYMIDIVGDKLKLIYLGPQGMPLRHPAESTVSGHQSQSTSRNYVITEATTDESESTACQSVNIQQVSTAYMSSSAQSIISQLSSGVYLTPKNSKDKKKLITLTNLKVNESQVAGILSSHPRMTLPELLKTLLKKSNKWALLNKFYNVSQYIVKEK